LSNLLDKAMDTFPKETVLPMLTELKKQTSSHNRKIKAFLKEIKEANRNKIIDFDRSSFMANVSKLNKTNTDKLYQIYRKYVNKV
jgi:hypothetical protein